MPRGAWSVGGSVSFNGVWESEETAREGGEAVFRVVARDHGSFTNSVARSAPIYFGTTSHAGSAAQRRRFEEQAFAGLQRIIELQERNIGQTAAQRAAPARTTAAQWDETAERQREIRRLAKELLDNPVRPLGGLTAAVKRLYGGEMLHAVLTLSEISAVPPAERDRPAAAAQRLEERILRQLRHTESAAVAAKVDRRVSGLSAMLLALVRGQAGVLKQPQTYAETGAEVGEALVETQDVLAEDLTAFATACERESEAVRANDEEFAGTLRGIAERCEAGKIRDDMIMAAERLEQDQPAGAVPFEQSALVNLRELQSHFDGVRLGREDAERTAMREALAQAKEKLARIQALHERMLESMDAVRGQQDKSDGDGQAERVLEAYRELVKNTRESLLEVPTDLHVFTDLNVANELVEDVYSVFEEVEQVPGSEEGTAADAIHLDYAKEDANLALMDEAMDRIDEMETWLQDRPDDHRVTTEAFDREEMPESGIALGPLADEVQDLISDLLDEPEDLDRATDDSASTHAVSDFPTGWGVEEGDTVTFSAKGKSGNQTPDHKEQDGRSNIGRQGMSVGETAAASGTISEGDEEIEERRTEDPTQSGRIELAGEADTRATGGGKQGSGKADDFGMSGGAKRMDSMEEGSWEGMAALLAKQADAVYAKASLKKIRVGSLREAAHHLRQSGDAVARGDIGQMREFRELAVSSLRRARAELSAGSSGGLEVEGTADILGDVVEGGPDLAPAAYRDRVAEYYRALNEAL